MQFVMKYYREVSSLSRFVFQNTAGEQILTLPGRPSAGMTFGEEAAETTCLLSHNREEK